MKLSPIQSYLRQQGIKCYKTKIISATDNIPVKLRLFADKEGNHVAISSVKVTQISPGISRLETALAVNSMGMIRQSTKIIESIRFKNFKNKKNVELPKNIETSSVIKTPDSFYFSESYSIPKTDIEFLDLVDGRGIYLSHGDYKMKRFGKFQEVNILDRLF